MRYIGKDNITACVLTSTGKPKFEKNFIKDSESWNLTEMMGYGDREGYVISQSIRSDEGEARITSQLCFHMQTSLSITSAGHLL